MAPDLFRALGDPTRVALLVTLATCGRACTVSEIAGCCAVDLSGVSRHLAILRRAGVLAAERRGREVYYRVRFATLTRHLRQLADAIESCCPTDEPFEAEEAPR